jgi:hypothetical protein
MLLGPSDGRFGQAMVPVLYGHRMVPDRAELGIVYSHRGEKLPEGG